MTLRARLALLTSGAVALSIVAASVAAWLLTQATLMSEVDQRLQDRLPDRDRIAAMTTRSAVRLDRGEQGVRILLDAEPIGVQRVDPEGRVVGQVPPGDVALPLTSEERRLFETAGDGVLLRTEEVEGDSYRVMSVGLNGQTFLRMVHPLDSVERTMGRMTWLLAVVAVVGVASAGGLGWLTVRAGLRPVDRLTEAAERVAATKDLAQRIEVGDSEQDEVSRLARSVNSMLAALDSARSQQRQLVEDAGHELRTPLAALRNDVGVLIRSEQHPERRMDPTDRARLLEDLEAEAEALSDLVGELIDLARGDIEPEPLVESDLRDMIEHAVTRTRRVDPRVRVAVRGPSVEVAVRPATLERAISNLIRNAVQVSDEGSDVDVELGVDGDWATVRVLDRGPGIADHDLPRLFDRFYRGHDARERHGSGLGLAIVAQAARQHRGSVDVENRPGGGAVFTLRIPISPDRPASP